MVASEGDEVSSSRVPLTLQILIGAYLAASAFALAVAIWDPAGDSLSAIYLVLVAMPWTIALSWITDGLGIESYGFNIVFLTAGILANVLLLYGLGRLIKRMSKR